MNAAGGKKSGQPFGPHEFFFLFPSLRDLRPRQTMEEQIAIWRSVGARVTIRSDDGE